MSDGKTFDIVTVDDEIQFRIEACSQTGSGFVDKPDQNFHDYDVTCTRSCTEISVLSDNSSKSSRLNDVVKSLSDLSTKSTAGQVTRTSSKSTQKDVNFENNQCQSRTLTVKTDKAAEQKLLARRAEVAASLKELVQGNQCSNSCNTSSVKRCRHVTASHLVTSKRLSRNNRCSVTNATFRGKGGTNETEHQIETTNVTSHAKRGRLVTDSQLETGKKLARDNQGSVNNPSRVERDTHEIGSQQKACEQVSRDKQFSDNNVTYRANRLRHEIESQLERFKKLLKDKQSSGTNVTSHAKRRTCRHKSDSQIATCESLSRNNQCSVTSVTSSAKTRTCRHKINSQLESIEQLSRDSQYSDDPSAQPESVFDGLDTVECWRTGTAVVRRTSIVQHLEEINKVAVVSNDRAMRKNEYQPATMDKIRKLEEQVNFLSQQIQLEKEKKLLEANHDMSSKSDLGQRSEVKQPSKRSKPRRKESPSVGRQGSKTQRGRQMNRQENVHKMVTNQNPSPVFVQSNSAKNIGRTDASPAKSNAIQISPNVNKYKPRKSVSKSNRSFTEAENNRPVAIDVDGVNEIHGIYSCVVEVDNIDSIVSDAENDPSTRGRSISLSRLEAHLDSDNVRRTRSLSRERRKPVDSSKEVVHKKVNNRNKGSKANKVESARIHDEVAVIPDVFTNSQNTTRGGRCRSRKSLIPDVFTNSQNTTRGGRSRSRKSLIPDVLTNSQNTTRGGRSRSRKSSVDASVSPPCQNAYRTRLRCRSESGDRTTAVSNSRSTPTRKPSVSDSEDDDDSAPASPMFECRLCAFVAKTRFDLNKHYVSFHRCTYNTSVLPSELVSEYSSDISPPPKTNVKSILKKSVKFNQSPSFKNLENTTEEFETQELEVSNDSLLSNNNMPHQIKVSRVSPVCTPKPNNQQTNEVLPENSQTDTTTTYSDRWMMHFKAEGKLVKSYVSMKEKELINSCQRKEPKLSLPKLVLKKTSNSVYVMDATNEQSLKTKETLISGHSVSAVTNIVLPMVSTLSKVSTKCPELSDELRTQSFQPSVPTRKLIDQKQINVNLKEEKSPRKVKTKGQKKCVSPEPVSGKITNTNPVENENNIDGLISESKTNTTSFKKCKKSNINIVITDKKHSIAIGNDESEVGMALDEKKFKKRTRKKSASTEIIQNLMDSEKNETSFECEQFTEKSKKRTRKKSASTETVQNVMDSAKNKMSFDHPQLTEKNGIMPHISPAHPVKQCENVHEMKKEQLRSTNESVHSRITISPCRASECDSENCSHKDKPKNKSAKTTIKQTSTKCNHISSDTKHVKPMESKERNVGEGRPTNKSVVASPRKGKSSTKTETCDTKFTRKDTTETVVLYHETISETGKVESVLVINSESQKSKKKRKKSKSPSMADVADSKMNRKRSSDTELFEKRKRESKYLSKPDVTSCMLPETGSSEIQTDLKIGKEMKSPSKPDATSYNKLQQMGRSERQTYEKKRKKSKSPTMHDTVSCKLDEIENLETSDLSQPEKQKRCKLNKTSEMHDKHVSSTEQSDDTQLKHKNKAHAINKHSTAVSESTPHLDSLHGKSNGRELENKSHTSKQGNEISVAQKHKKLGEHTSSPIASPEIGPTKTQINHKSPKYSDVFSKNIDTKTTKTPAKLRIKLKDTNSKEQRKITTSHKKVTEKDHIDNTEIKTQSTKSFPTSQSHKNHTENEVVIKKKRGRPRKHDPCQSTDAEIVSGERHKTVEKITEHIEIDNTVIAKKPEDTHCDNHSVFAMENSIEPNEKNDSVQSNAPLIKLIQNDRTCKVSGEGQDNEGSCKRKLSQIEDNETFEEHLKNKRFRKFSDSEKSDSNVLPENDNKSVDEIPVNDSQTSINDDGTSENETLSISDDIDLYSDINDFIGALSLNLENCDGADNKNIVTIEGDSCGADNLDLLTDKYGHGKSGEKVFETIKEIQDVRMYDNHDNRVDCDNETSPKTMFEKHDVGMELHETSLDTGILDCSTVKQGSDSDLRHKLLNDSPSKQQYDASVTLTGQDTEIDRCVSEESTEDSNFSKISQRHLVTAKADVPQLNLSDAAIANCDITMNSEFSNSHNTPKKSNKLEDSGSSNDHKLFGGEQTIVVSNEQMSNSTCTNDSQQYSSNESNTVTDRINSNYKHCYREELLISDRSYSECVNKLPLEKNGGRCEADSEMILTKVPRVKLKRVSHETMSIDGCELKFNGSNKTPLWKVVNSPNTQKKSTSNKTGHVNCIETVEDNMSTEPIPECKYTEEINFETGEDLSKNSKMNTLVTDSLPLVKKNEEASRPNTESGDHKGKKRRHEKHSHRKAVGDKSREITDFEKAILHSGKQKKIKVKKSKQKVSRQGSVESGESINETNKEIISKFRKKKQENVTNQGHLIDQLHAPPSSRLAQSIFRKDQRKEKIQADDMPRIPTISRDSLQPINSHIPDKQKIDPLPKRTSSLPSFGATGNQNKKPKRLCELLTRSDVHALNLSSTKSSQKSTSQDDRSSMQLPKFQKFTCPPVFQFNSGSNSPLKRLNNPQEVSGSAFQVASKFSEKSMQLQTSTTASGYNNLIATKASPNVSSVFNDNGLTDTPFFGSPSSGLRFGTLMASTPADKDRYQQLPDKPPVQSDNFALKIPNNITEISQLSGDFNGLEDISGVDLLEETVVSEGVDQVYGDHDGVAGGSDVKITAECQGYDSNNEKESMAGGDKKSNECQGYDSNNEKESMAGGDKKSNGLDESHLDIYSAACSVDVTTDLSVTEDAMNWYRKQLPITRTILNVPSRPHITSPIGARFAANNVNNLGNSGNEVLSVRFATRVSPKSDNHNIGDKNVNVIVEPSNQFIDNGIDLEANLYADENHLDYDDTSHQSMSSYDEVLAMPDDSEVFIARKLHQAEEFPRDLIVDEGNADVIDGEDQGYRLLIVEGSEGVNSVKKYTNTKVVPPGKEEQDLTSVAATHSVDSVEVNNCTDVMKAKNTHRLRITECDGKRNRENSRSNKVESDRKGFIGRTSDKNSEVAVNENSKEDRNSQFDKLSNADSAISSKDGTSTSSAAGSDTSSNKKHGRNAKMEIDRVNSEEDCDIDNKRNSYGNSNSDSERNSYSDSDNGSNADSDRNAESGTRNLCNSRNGGSEEDNDEIEAGEEAAGVTSDVEVSINGDEDEEDVLNIYASDDSLLLEPEVIDEPSPPSNHASASPVLGGAAPDDMDIDDEPAQFPVSSTSPLDSVSKPEMIKECIIKMEKFSNSGDLDSALQQFTCIQTEQIDLQLIHRHFQKCLHFGNVPFAFQLLQNLYCQHSLTTEVVNKFIHCCCQNSFQDSRMFGDLMQMIKNHNMAPKFECVVVLLRTFADTNSWSRLWDTMFYCRELDGFMVPVPFVNRALVAMVENPRQFFDQADKWLRDSYEEQLSQIDAEVLQKVCKVFHDRGHTNMADLLQRCAANNGRRTPRPRTPAIPQIESPDESQPIDWPVESNQDKQMWMNRLNGITFTKQWQILGQLYVERCGLRLPVQSCYVDKFTMVLLSELSTPGVAFQAFIQSVMKTFDAEKLDNDTARLDLRGLVTIGHSLIHNLYEKSYWEQAYIVLCTLTNTDLDYLSSQRKIPVRALEVCLQLNEPESALQVLNCTQIKSLDPASRGQLVGLLRELFKQLYERSRLKECHEVLALAFSKVFIDNAASFEYSKTFSIAESFSHLVVRCLETSDIQLAIRTYNLYRRHNQTFIVDPEIWRSLLVAAMEANFDEATAYNLFTVCRNNKIFPLQIIEKQIHEPRKIVIPVWMTWCEAYLVIMDYVQVLYNVICDQVLDNMLTSRDDLELIVVIKGIINPGMQSKMPYLSGISLSPKASEQMVLGVLLNKLDPPLQARRVAPCRIHVNPDSLENYLQHQDLNGRKQGLKFLPVLPNQMSGHGRPNMHLPIPVRGRGQPIRRGLRGGRRPNGRHMLRR